MGRKVLANNSGKGTSTLGSKAGNVSGAFSGGRASTKKTNRVATGKNKANAGPSKGSKKGLSLSHKDGQRSGGNAKLSSKTRGPSGRNKKSKGISGR